MSKNSLGPIPSTPFPRRHWRRFDNTERSRRNRARGPVEADKQLPSLQTLGINLDDISEKLQLDGIAAFAAAYDKVVAPLEKKSVIVAGGPGRHPLKRF